MNDEYLTAATVREDFCASLSSSISYEDFPDMGQSYYAQQQQYPL
jgi:hypothetical protein